MIYYKLYTNDGQFIKEVENLYPAIGKFSGMVEYVYGTKEWLLNGIRHRDNDKPAIVNIDGHKEWWVNMMRHRIGGPAVIHSNGDKYWYVNNIECSEEEHDLLYNMMKIKGLM